MSPLPLLVVIGATGTQGGSVLNHFLLASPNTYRLRGVTRNTKSDASKSLVSRGVEMVSANVDDTKSLVKAFEGASAIFSVTDFWNPFFNPASRAAAEKAGKSINLWTYEYELQQGKNIFDAAVQVPSLDNLVFSSLADVRGISGGKYKESWHFDSKAHAEVYCKDEYPELWSKTSVIQIGHYLTNLLSHPLLAPKKAEDGTLVFAAILDGDVPLPQIATEIDTGPLTHALLAAEPGKNLLAYRQMMSMNEYVEVFNKVTGAKAIYVPVTFEKMAQGTPPELVQELADTFWFVRDYGWAGEKVQKDVVLPEQLDLPVNLGTVEDWIKAQDWSALLK